MLDIYYDSLTEANWFSNLNQEFSLTSNNYYIIKRRGGNPSIVEQIVKYDKPDIIVIKDETPLLVLEITQEVPTGHNVGQRFARLVRAIELGIPTIYFFPFDAMKHGEYAGICNLNIRLLKAAENILKIHCTPLLCINWQTDINGEIITNGTEDETIKAILASYVSSGYNKKCEGFIDQLNYMKDEYILRLSKRPSYKTLPNSVPKMKTTEFINKFNIEISDNSFVNREFTYVYIIKMTPAKCRREDPYTGTIFVYDYMCCRIGPDVKNKKSNIVFYFPRIEKNVWEQKNPNDLARKSSNWYLTANMIIFKDGYSFLR